MVRAPFDGLGCGIPSGTHERGLHNLGRHLEAHNPTDEHCLGQDPFKFYGGSPIKYPNHPQALVKLKTITGTICHTQGMRARLRHLGRDAEG